MKSIAGQEYTQDVELRDALTGVQSRLLFKVRLQAEAEKARRTGQIFSLLFIDLDYFKSINDGFGHRRGDQVLVEFARRLMFSMRTQDLAFRYGGDEFVVIMPHTSKDQAVFLGQQLLVRIQNTPFHGFPPLSLSLSIGISSFPVDGHTPETLLEAADRRVYQAKRAGRGRVIAEDLPQSSEPFELDPPRLIERDGALERLRLFAEAWPGQTRSMLRVNGGEGCGHSRFLAEICKFAQLHSYAVLLIQGQAALRSRVYGAISETRREWPAVPSPSAGVGPFASALWEAVRQKNQTGLLIAIDDWHLLDPASLDFLHELFFSGDLPQLALAYTESVSGLPRDFLPEVSHHTAIHLEPLSSEGVHIWLRQSLKWEPPADFIEWLFKETGGQPRNIQRGLAYLINQKMLEPRAGGTLCHPEYLATPLAKLLEEQPDTPPHNLPSNLPDFIGREEEIDQLKLLLRKQRLVSIVGPGGLGKTRLALQAVAESLERFPDGVFFIPVGALSTENHMVAAMAEGLRFSFTGPRDAKVQLLNYLRSKEMLLLLDNFEHLFGGTGLLPEILEYAPGIRLLVTTRERLNVPEETPFELGELPFPLDDTDENLEAYNSVQLFLHRARQVRPDFTLGLADRPWVAHICRVVEGMPLGIELAAAWVQTFSCQEIANQIDRNLAFLATDRPNLLHRPRSILAILDSFWSLLSKSEQGVLRRLSVFRGSFSTEAANRVAGASLFFLDALANKTYLRRSRTAPGHYEMHELLQQYLAERLRARPAEQIHARSRHLAYYAKFLKLRQEHLLKGKAALQEISRELDNVRTAWDWALQTRHLNLIQRSLAGLFRFYLLSGLFEEGQKALGGAIDTLLEHEQGSPAQEVRPILAGLLAKRAFLLSQLARYDQAMEAAQRSVAMAKTIENPAVEAEGHLYWGQVLLYKSDFNAARQQLELARAQACAAHDPRLEAECLQRLVKLAYSSSNTIQARGLAVRALHLFRQAGNRRGEGTVLNSLGGIHQIHDEPAKARPYFQKFLHIAQQIGDRHSEGGALINLGMVTSRTNDPAAGRAYLEQAVRIFHSMGDRRSEGFALVCLTYVLPSLGEFTAARRTGDAALALLRAVGDRAYESEALIGLALVHHLLGEDEAARDYSQQALQILRSIGAPSIETDAHLVLGHALVELERFSEAEATYQEALRLQRDQNQPKGAIETLAGMARLALARNDFAGARESILEILVFLETNTTDGMREPMRVYLTCVQILYATGDPRSIPLLHNAYLLLKNWAGKIEDETFRRSFLENVPSHRALVVAYHQMLAEQVALTSPVVS